MARERQGSRIIQKKLDEAGDVQRRMIFNALEPDFKELIFDPCANFVIQKLCENATEKEQKVLNESTIFAMLKSEGINRLNNNQEKVLNALSQESLRNIGHMLLVHIKVYFLLLF